MLGAGILNAEHARSVAASYPATQKIAAEAALTVLLHKPLAKREELMAAVAAALPSLQPQSCGPVITALLDKGFLRGADGA